MTQYLVTVNKGTDINAFYNDMETSGGSETIPDREVSCYNRKPISRSTGYDLEDDEITALQNDSRVRSIIPQSEVDDIVATPSWEQTSSQFDKGNTIGSNMKNWGLLRCFNGTQTAGWGWDATHAASGTVTTTSSGKNVDVVIMDGIIDPNHPEMAVEVNGSGGTRVNQFNWLSLTNDVTGGVNGNYSYSFGNNRNDNHGMHVAGIACGNTQGWARDANIFNLNPYGDGQIGIFNVIDYVRVWHNQKGINEITGRKNPTIVNMSFTYHFTAFNRSLVQGINFRGSIDTSVPFTDQEYADYGFLNWEPVASGDPLVNLQIDAYVDPWLADIEDAADDGIIFIAAAGNQNSYIDREDGSDWDNHILLSGGTQRFYNRGGAITSCSRAGNPGVTAGQRLVVTTGAVGPNADDKMSTFSNRGPRVDLFAPGAAIMSSVHGDASNIVVDDPRDSSKKLTKLNGTSMASPQICGLIACLLEQYPGMNIEDVHSYLTGACPSGQIPTTSGGFDDTTDLNGATNEYAKYKFERPLNGVQEPRVTVNSRRNSEDGVKYPRTRTKNFNPV